jgi:pimeloyl-ACP methyl ester carboxylesterase
VICHGFKGFKDWGMFPVLAVRLAQAGFTTVSFNFTGSGVGPDGESFSEPLRFAHDTYSRQLVDLSLVVQGLTQATLVPELRPPPRVGLLGHSRGGGIAVLEAARETGIRALVTWSAISTAGRWDSETVRRWRERGTLEVVNMRTGEVLPLTTDVLDDLAADQPVGRLDIQAAARQVKVPWLILHGEIDESVAVAEATSLATANPLATLRIIPGAGHTFGARHPWKGSTPELDQAMSATVEWFGRELL